MASDIDFAGKLSFLNLGELLQILGSSAATGVLHIFNPHRAEPGSIVVEKGNPVNASNGSLSGLDALFSLFGWTEGRFEFVREAVSCERTITKGRMEIILDGLRLLDEGKIERLNPLPRNAEVPHESTETAGAKMDQPPMIRGPLVDYSYVVDEEAFYDGDEIVREGAHGNWIWVILEGVAEIIKTTSNGPLKLLRVADGAFLGSLASLLIGDSVRGTTVVASGNIQLGMLDSQLLSSELASLSPDFRTLIQSLDNRLRSLTGIAAGAYARNHAFMELIKGKKIAIREEQKEERMFRIRKGEVVVARGTPSGFVPLALLQHGDVFGHIPFLRIGHEPYSAAVFSTSDLKLEVVDSGKIETEHRQLSPTLRNVIEHIAACISATTLVTINAIRKSGVL